MARTTATNRTTSTARVADGYRLNRQEHSPSASFNGSSTGITLGFKANSTGFTIATWIKVRRFTSGDRIFDQQDSGPSKGFAVLMPVTASDRSLYFSVFGDSSEEANIKIALNIWEWTHIAISFEPNSAKFYKNGVLAGTDTSVSLGDSVTNLVIGKNASLAANYFNGLMKDFVVYDRVLSLAEVENVRDGIVSQTNLKCYLPLSSDLADISVNGNDGTGTAVFTYTNDSPFYDAVGLNMYAPLKSSLLLERGVGYPTWSRATKAWGFNELGYLTEIASGCAFFGGARLVRNTVRTNSEDFSSAAWVKAALTVSGTNTVVCANATSQQFIYQASSGTSITTGQVLLCCVRLKHVAGGADFVQIAPGSSGFGAGQYATISLVDGSTNVVGCTATATSVAADTYDFCVRFTATATGAFETWNVCFVGSLAAGRIPIFVGDGVKSFELLRAWSVDVTGYDASYVPEYVSVGVASSPYFGAGIDGAKYFETDWQGAPIAAANLLGFRREASATNNLLHSRDLSNAAWSTKTNITAAKTATGLDGIADTATTLTATAADAIILQPITLASAARCASAYVKRRTGTGTISFTQDGGSTWTDITSQINSSTWSRVQITATLANPSVGFKISTLGDAIDVDCVQNEAGSVATSPIVTTTSTVTRNAESLTYQTASNWSDTAGTAYIEAQPVSWVAGGAIGSATNGLLLSAANSGATASDGTNTANGPAGSPSGRKKLALRWGAGAMTVASGGVVGTPGTYDGGMGLASVGIAVNSSAYCGPVAIYNYQMTDAELQALTT
jgi:hypothetical protein